MASEAKTDESKLADEKVEDKLYCVECDDVAANYVCKEVRTLLLFSVDYHVPRKSSRVKSE